MTARRIGDKRELLLLLQLLSFNIKSTARNRNKRTNTVTERVGVMWKNITMRMN